MRHPPARPRACPRRSTRALAVAAALIGPRAAAAAHPPEDPAWAVQVGASTQQGLAPPFYATPRDRLAVEAAGWWRPAPTLELSAQVDLLRHDGGIEEEAPKARTGPGDLRLGTAVRLWPGAVEGRAGVWVKLPNADDERELGTDETDVGGAGALRLRAGPLRLDLHGGAELRGDPARTRSQDPVALLGLAAATQLGPVAPHLRLDAELPTQRQPGRAVIAAGLARACPLRLGAEGLAGLTTAGPEWGARLWLGVAGGCADGRGARGVDDAGESP